MYWVLLTVIFAAYSTALFCFLQWFARRRIAALADPSQFSNRQKILANIGVIALSGAPPLAEMAIRPPNQEFGNLMSLAFVGAWVISVFPCYLACLKTLKAGGIDPSSAHDA
jgi:hypothetical protein